MEAASTTLAATPAPAIGRPATRYEIFALAVDSLTDPRTTEKFLDGENVRDDKRVAIWKSVQRLGLRHVVRFEIDRNGSHVDHVTTAQAAREIDRSVRTVFRLVEAEDLEDARPHKAPGCPLAITRESLNAYRQKIGR